MKSSAVQELGSGDFNFAPKIRRPKKWVTEVLLPTLARSFRAKARFFLATNNTPLQLHNPSPPMESSRSFRKLRECSRRKCNTVREQDDDPLGD